MSTVTANTRRDFLKKISLTGGGLMLGFKWFSARAEMPAILQAADPVVAPAFNSYLSIAPDGTIHIFSPNPELGQNIMTSFAQIVAEELDADWKKVKVSQAPLDTTKYERQLTGGSGAIPHSWMRLRKAGASARYLLLQAAAQRWGVPAAECTADSGFIIHKPSGKKLSYGELSTEAAKIELPKDVPLKDRKDFKLIGKPIRNIKNPDIIAGKPIFGIDFKREGMVLAMVQRPPAFGTKIKSIDAAAVKAQPGIIDVVQFQQNVAIVGKSTWEIMKAKKLLNVAYEKEGNIESTSDHEALFTKMMDAPNATVQRKDGDVAGAFQSAAKVIKREYQCPFLPHSPLEPMNFFAHVRPDGIELVGPTQTPQRAREAVSKLLGVPEDKITVDITRLGGGFGRRLKFDYVVEAAELSSIIKKPVKVIWTREDDMTGGSYRPAVRYRFEAALDASGNLVGYKLRGVGVNAGNSTRQDNFPAGAIPNLLIESVDHVSPITTGAWRAPITNFLAFAEQTFLDEVAEAAGKDPVQFRLELLDKARKSPTGKISYDIERFDTVIRQVAADAGWGTKKPGVFQGFSVYFSHASYVGQVCDVVMKDGKPSIEKIYAVSDCGQVINMSGALQQVRGAIVDGYGHAMFGKLSFDAGKPEQNNFNSYRLIRMKEIPEVDARFVDNGKDPTGLGEPALPPTGGAVANAIFKATGQRLYRQPFIEEPLFKKLAKEEEEE
jgi:isoquinoline 1-oxidoreductase beta subunit